MHSPSEALWSARERKCDLVLLEMGLGSTLEHWRKAAGEDATFPEWHLHDLRRTAATRMTGMGKLGVTRLHVSFVLNHSVPGVTGVYDLYEYLAEKTRVLDLWGARLTAIVEDNVVVSLEAAPGLR